MDNIRLSMFVKMFRYTFFDSSINLHTGWLLLNKLFLMSIYADSNRSLWL